LTDEQPTKAATAIDDLLERSSTGIPLLLRAKEEAKRLVKDDPPAGRQALPELPPFPVPFSGKSRRACGDPLLSTARRQSCL
jgi:hypothetical protein